MDISFDPQEVNDGRIRHRGVWSLQPDAEPAAGRFDLVVPGIVNTAMLSRATEGREWSSVGQTGLKNFGQFSVGHLADQGSMKVSVYPNPAQGMFNLRIDGTEKNYQAVISDELGKTLRVLPINGNSTVQVKGLHPGTYFVQIPDPTGADNRFTQKIAIIR